MTPLKRLLNRVGDPLNQSKPRPLVSLEEFFERNEDPESLTAHERSRSDPQCFFLAFQHLRGKKGFHDILVEVAPRLTDSGWPCSETLCIVSQFDRSELPIQLTQEVWQGGFLPHDWLSYPRVDDVLMEPLDVPNGAWAFGFAYY